jgi:(p)ppGpp synthase/HD superfamily hydrolase
MNETNTKPQQFAEQFGDAFAYAARLHASHLRKGTTIPYIAHLMSVTALVLEMGGDEDEAIAALLHDAVEDQGGAETREDIRLRFGDHVVRIVDGCTDTDTIPKPPWRERKEQHIAHLHHATPEVLRVALADKLHNARSLLFDLQHVGPSVWDRFNATEAETLWYYQTLVRLFRDKSPGPFVDELDQVVSNLEKLSLKRTT